MDTKDRSVAPMECALWRPFDKISTRPRGGKPDSGPWWVSEKIHGANFTVLCSGCDVRFAKRNAILNHGERFFSYETIADALAAAAQKAWAHQITREPDMRLLAIHGELYGGGYPRVGSSCNPPDEHLRKAHDFLAPVQTGIWYS